MKHLKVYESGKSGTPWDYRQAVRKVINLIKSNVEVNKYTNKILTLVATNKKLHKNISKNITDDFKSNLEYILNNLEMIVEIVTYTDFRGRWGELVVSYLLGEKFNLNVIEPTDDEDISGIDLITVGNSKLTHQVKILYSSVDTGKIFKVINKFIDIKQKDNYNYLWFFISDDNKVVGFNHNNIVVVSKNYGYDILYNKPENIKYYDIPKHIVNDCHKRAKEDIKSKISEEFLNIDPELWKSWTNMNEFNL